MKHIGEAAASLQPHFLWQFVIDLQIRVVVIVLVIELSILKK